jgi:hypothetical protein
MSQNVIREEAVGFEPVPSVAHLRANLRAVVIQAEVQLLQHRFLRLPCVRYKVEVCTSLLFPRESRSFNLSPSTFRSSLSFALKEQARVPKSDAQ